MMMFFYSLLLLDSLNRSSSVQCTLESISHCTLAHTQTLFYIVDQINHMVYSVYTLTSIKSSWYIPWNFVVFQDHEENNNTTHMEDMMCC